jgi:LPS-assembly protein
MTRLVWILALLIVPAAGAEQEQPTAQPPPGSVILEAGEQEQLEDGHVLARGYVVIQQGNVRLQADTVEFWNEEMRVVAEGNVVFQQGDQKIVGTRMEVNLNDGTGRFFNAHGVAGEDFYFYGDIVERESEDVYVIERGAFTSCVQPVPRWRFTAGKARVRRDHHVRLHNTFLKVKSIPVFYMPLVYYPIDEEGRSTGFLMPQIGQSSLKGFLVSQGFFWAINRSMDATIDVDWFSKAGVGTGAEYRYVMSEASRGQFLTYFLKDKTTEQREYNLNYSMNQELPGGFRATARVNYFSSFDYQQRYQENYNSATRRSKRASGNIVGKWSQYNFRVLFDRNDTSFGDRVAVRQILPRITMNSRATKLGPTPLLFSFSSEASRLARTTRDTEVEYQRFDVFPQISYPFTSLPFLTFRTTLMGRYTYYTSQLNEDRDYIDEDIDRRYYEIKFDMRGPTFARIFNTPGNFYAERYKHVIEPQLVWSYRSRIDGFDEIPKFDSQDYVPGTNQVSFSLVNRFYAKKEAEGDRPSAPVEFLTWVLSQRYFFDINASLYDRQFSTPYFTPLGTPSNYSPVTSRLSFRPDRNLNVSWNLEYDVNFHKMRSISLAGTFTSRSWGSVRGMWSRRNLLDSGRVRRNLRGLGTVRLSDSIQTNIDVAYDLERKDMTQIRAGIDYNVQCCGFLFEFSRYSYGNLRDENMFRFGVTLANIGTFGTFLGGRGGQY